MLGRIPVTDAVVALVVSFRPTVPDILSAGDAGYTDGMCPLGGDVDKEVDDRYKIGSFVKYGLGAAFVGMSLYWGYKMMS